jgi:hypothetical protein
MLFFSVKQGAILFPAGADRQGLTSWIGLTTTASRISMMSGHVIT